MTVRVGLKMRTEWLEMVCGGAGVASTCTLSPLTLLSPKLCSNHFPAHNQHRLLITCRHYSSYTISPYHIIHLLYDLWSCHLNARQYVLYQESCSLETMSRVILVHRLTVGCSSQASPNYSHYWRGLMKEEETQQIIV